MQPINLLPDLKTQRRERLRLSLPRILATAAAAWFLLLTIVYGVFYWQQNSLQARMQVLAAEIEALEPVAQRVAEMQELSQAIDSLRELIAHNTRGAVIPAIDLISSLLPAEIRAQQVAVDQGRVNLACYSSALTAIGQLYANLQQAPQFGSVQFSTITSVGPSGYAFTVTLELQGADTYE